ncbi:MAG: membrane protein insertion efficiency factor YidD [Deltaproteobacteria bacterium]|nr:membrane protein insertion efficiency factor YidD [Deltaproteobacteria bacterium]
MVFSPILSGLGANCRFHPTCSDYAREAFQKKSSKQAVALILKRLMRCGPWHPGGVDKVPN